MTVSKTQPPLYGLTSEDMICVSHSVTLVASIWKVPPVGFHVWSCVPTLTAKFCAVCRVGGIDKENSGLVSV